MYLTIWKIWHAIARNCDFRCTYSCSDWYLGYVLPFFIDLLLSRIKLFIIFKLTNISVKTLVASKTLVYIIFIVYFTSIYKKKELFWCCYSLLFGCITRCCNTSKFFQNLFLFWIYEIQFQLLHFDIYFLRRRKLVIIRMH